MARPDLRALPPALRVLGAGYLITLGLAYAVALLAQYRGGAGGTNAGAGADGAESDLGAADPQASIAEDSLPSLGREWETRDQGMEFPKPFKEMILTTHLHLLSISGILLLVGALFAFSSFPERAKAWIIAAGFAGLALDYACMWGLRYAGPGFAGGVFLFGFLQSLSLAVQMLSSLKDLLFPGPARA
jgi:hypothetical protein